jgi:hypothetical protein
MRSTYVPALLVLLALALPLAAEPGDDVRFLRERWLQARAASGAGIFDSVHLDIQGGTVVLRGRVTRVETRDALVVRTGSLAGGRAVRSEIVVLPVSARDDALRLGLARAIYGNPSFRAYAAMTHPPIHIVVEDGYVTLEGVVETAVERSLAGSIAASLDVAGLVNALRTRAEVAADR